MDIFSIMPVEVFQDDRLTKTDFRVLGAFFSIRDKNTNLCADSIERIQARCLLDDGTVTRSIGRLRRFGWLDEC